MNLKFLNNLKDKVHFELNINWMLIMPVMLLIGVIAGEGYFFITTINPAMQANNKVSTDLASARRALAAPGRVPETDANKVRAQLANAQATLAATLNTFLSDAQVNQIMDGLAQYANESGVKIANLQAQPATTQKDLFGVSVVKLTVNGSSRKLIDFVSRIKEASTAKGFVINNITLSGGDGAMATLVIDMALYTNNYATNSAAVAEQAKPTTAPAPKPAQPTPVPPTAIPPTLVPATATPVPPTPIPPTPTRAIIVYVVRSGDTMFAIAQRYNTTVDAIMALNRLPNFVVRVGQTLQIPVR
jgi:LysM repeat protein